MYNSVAVVVDLVDVDKVVPAFTVLLGVFDAVMPIEGALWRLSGHRSLMKVGLDAMRGVKVS